MELTDYHAKYFAWELTKRHPLGSPGRVAGAVANAQVDLQPHQVDAALFAFASPLTKGAILADEVGLGKTIEAGLVLAQRWAERKRRILVITPANLRKQWNQELLEKFFLPSLILEKRSYAQEAAGGNRSPFFQQDRIVICSYHFASARQGEVSSVPWDLVVIDEAHKLRNVYRKDNRIANALKAALQGRHKVLLTATPLQNSLMELYGLVSFVDEHVFGNIGSFKQQFFQLNDERAFQSLQSRIAHVCHRTLRRQVVHKVRYTKRTAIVEAFTPTDREIFLYDQVNAYLQRPNLMALPPGQRNLITLILRKLLASSTMAIAGALGTMAVRLRETLTQRAADAGLLELLDEDFEALDEVEDEWELDDTAKELIRDRDLIEREIEELHGFADLAAEILSNAKGEKLLTGLAKAFEKATELGALRKAIVFTESRKTQDYLVRLLTQSGQYSRDEIVLFNGTNADPDSRGIYREWLERHQSSDRVTGSPTADMRSALVDYFKEKATIMIATEAGAEGINLQFCSLVVNYDLPWNPQRIEQRIGRCHRYGQKSDVVVLNFLNTANAADQRVYQLLDSKFQLFDGVFGASDEILGAIGNGVDFERRVVEIYQNCRNPAEIQAEFDRLQAEFQAEISEELKTTRSRLLENFDEEVIEKLKRIGEDSEQALARHEELLLRLTHHVLAAHVERLDTGAFILQSLPADLDAASCPLGRYELPRRSGEAHLYRSEHPLGQHVLRRASQVATPVSELVFHLSSHAGRITALSGLIGESGWMLVRGLRVEALDAGEDHLVLVAVTEGGEVLDPEDVERLLRVRATVSPAQPTAEAVAEWRSNCEVFSVEQRDDILAKVGKRNADYFEMEVAKLEAWADDRKSTLEREIKELDRQIKEARRAMTGSLTLAAKVEAQRVIGELEKERTRLRRELFETQDQIDAERDALIDEVAGKLEAQVEEQELFFVRWVLK